jgi:hypothetical protein
MMAHHYKLERFSKNVIEWFVRASTILFISSSSFDIGKRCSKPITAILTAPWPTRCPTLDATLISSSNSSKFFQEISNFMPLGIFILPKICLTKRSFEDIATGTRLATISRYQSYSLF